MRILLCSQNALTRALGAPKVLIELGQSMQAIGWEVGYLQPSDLKVAAGKQAAPQFREALRQYLVLHADQYDVIDYDHGYLPYPRQVFSSRPLMVARSVLLIQQSQAITIPRPRSIRSRVAGILRGRQHRKLDEQWLSAANETVRQADLVNVSNEHDYRLLVGDGLSSEKVVVLPFGLDSVSRASLEQIPLELPARPCVAFVGSFDYRKGALDFPLIVRTIAAAIPEVRFKLIGTSGLFSNPSSVLAFFDSALRPCIEVIPRFKPHDLSSHLANTSIGIFPSYLEGFGFGVLEMLAAGTPVVAYDSPGPPMLLDSKWLVPAGDAAAMASKVIGLLKTPVRLASAKVEARERSSLFRWENVAANTDRIYRAAIDNRRQTSINDRLMGRKD